MLLYQTTVPTAVFVYVCHHNSILINNRHAAHNKSTVSIYIQYMNIFVSDYIFIDFWLQLKACRVLLQPLFPVAKSSCLGVSAAISKDKWRW